MPNANRGVSSLGALRALRHAVSRDHAVDALLTLVRQEVRAIRFDADRNANRCLLLAARIGDMTQWGRRRPPPSMAVATEALTQAVERVGDFERELLAVLDDAAATLDRPRRSKR